MLHYQVGQPFPFPEGYQMPSAEVPLLQTNESFFDIVFFSTVPKDDAWLFAKSTLRYGIYERDNVPFFVVDLKNFLSFDVSLNIHKVQDDKVEAWLNSEGNVINMYLVGLLDGKLYRIRTIAIQPQVADKMRNIAHAQDIVNENAQQVDEKISAISSAVTTGQMIEEIKMYTL